ncbi:MAG: glycosyltransferase [Eubacteriales bacterium]
MMKTDYAFLGGLFPNHIIDEVKSNSIGTVQFAANNLQWGYVCGLEDNLGHSIKLINRMFIGSYPQKYHKPFVKYEHFSHLENSDDVNVGFINIMPLRQMTINRAPVSEIIHWLSNGDIKNKALFVYSTNFMYAVRQAKMYAPNLYICLIIPDLPIFMDLSRNDNPLIKLRKKYQSNELQNSLKYVDCIVPITKQMQRLLDPGGIRSSVIIEGMVNPNTVSNYQSNTLDTVTFAYTGTLTKQYGVLNLVNSFMQTDNKNYRLVICGKGDTEVEIRQAENTDSRISYLGSVSPIKAEQIQNSADILVNPRKNEGEYTKYSFPSKTMDYMAAGKPVLCYRLDGIPNEYDNYLCYVGEQRLITAMKFLAEKPKEELKKIGCKNRNFVYINKNRKSQTYRIIEVIENGSVNK